MAACTADLLPAERTEHNTLCTYPLARPPYTPALARHYSQDGAVDLQAEVNVCLTVTVKERLYSGFREPVSVRSRIRSRGLRTELLVGLATLVSLQSREPSSGSSESSAQGRLQVT